MRVEDVYSDCSDDGDDSEMPVSEDEEPLQVHREYIKPDVVIAYCIGSYYLRKVCSESGLLAVVKIMAEVPEDKEKISVQHYKSVACISKLIFQLWTHGGNQLESVAKDSIVHHLAVPDMVKGGRIRFEAGELPSSNLK